MDFGHALYNKVRSWYHTCQIFTSVVASAPITLSLYGTESCQRNAADFVSSHDGFVKEEIKQVHMKDAGIIKCSTQNVIAHDDLAERVPGERKGAPFAFELLLGADGVCGLDIDPLPSLDDEHDFF